MYAHQQEARMILQSINFVCASFNLYFFNKLRMYELLPFVCFTYVSVAVQTALVANNMIRRFNDDLTFGEWLERRPPWVYKLMHVVFIFDHTFLVSIYVYLAMNVVATGATISLAIRLASDDSSSTFPVLMLCWLAVQVPFFYKTLSLKVYLPFSAYMRSDLIHSTCVNDVAPLDNMSTSSVVIAIASAPPPPAQKVYSVVSHVLQCEFDECSKCTCCICLESMNNLPVDTFQQCGHSLHQECWSKLVENAPQTIRCPQCRTLVSM